MNNYDRIHFISARWLQRRGGFDQAFNSRFSPTKTAGSATFVPPMVTHLRLDTLFSFFLSSFPALNCSGKQESFLKLKCLFITC